MEIFNAEITQNQYDESEVEQYPLRICQSGAGYYIGRVDEDGFPYSRESVEYFETLEQVSTAFEMGSWTQRPHY